MNSLKIIMAVIAWLSCHALTACSNQAPGNSLTGKICAGSSSSLHEATNSAATDSVTVQKDDLTKIYTQAIAEFIKAVYKKDKTTFDTLFFGKHVYGQPDDFPDIELPETIENTHIRLVTPEAGHKKQTERKSLVYVNMMGWVDAVNAEFMFVVFANATEHQYDYFISFTYNPARIEFELGKIEFENYKLSKTVKPERINIYSNGKYSKGN